MKDAVSLRDIYEVVNRLEDKVDKRLTVVEQDIDNLQTFQNRTLGMATIIAAFMSGAVTYIWNKVTKG